MGPSHTTRFAHVWGGPHKTDKAKDIGPNIVPVCVFVIMGGGEEGTGGGKAVG